MPLDPIRQLNDALADRYTVEREVGTGGMATVYVARDVRHDRLVAIKVLRPELSAVLGADRFLSEIKTTAALQHPHILPLFDSGDADGSLFYVMPLVEGETVRARLERETQLPVADATRIAREVAAALDYAHRRGVVHRDIKPENILLQDGNALVADFGIALAVSSAGGQRLTQTGISLGTPSYMAPEQAMGERNIDARADIYALGAVTYEMLAGEPPFTGPTIQATVARVIAERPRSLTAQRPSVPVHVDEAILKSLEKLPADRFATANEFALALAEPAHARATPSTFGHRRLTASIVGGIVAAGVVGFLVGRRYERQRAPTYPPSRLSVAGALVGWGSQPLQRQLTLSPDGSTLFYVTPLQNGRGQLVRQRLDAAEPTPVTGVLASTSAPVFSPDGRSFIAWAGSERQAYRYRMAGGEGTPVEVTGGYTAFAQWDPGGLWFSPTNGGGVWRLANGDSTTPRMDSTSRHLRFQQLLSDGRHALVLTHSETATAPAAVFDVQTGTTSPLLTTQVVEVRYAAGYLLYVLPSGAIEAAPFDESTRHITGPPLQIGTGVSVTGNGVAQFAVAANGTVAYAVEETPSLVFTDRAGASRPALDDRRTYHGPRFSPDGRRLAFDFISTDGRDVWVLSLSDGALTRASFERDGHDVVWTPDGRHISFLSARSGKEAVYRKPVAGTDPAERLFESAQLGFTGMWLSDGSAFVPQMNDLRPGSGSDIAIVGNGGHGPAAPFAASDFGESHPAVSPNSQWLAFTSDQSGRPEVYVRPLKGDGDQVQVSINGGTEAVWSRDGNAIFFRSIGPDQPQLVEARAQSTPTFAILSRHPLFPVGDVIPGNPHANYDVSPDGKTFAMVRRSPVSRIMVIQNLPALVRAAAAPAK